MPHALIATLGLSPGTVTGLYSTLLKTTDYRPDEIHLIMTTHTRVNDAATMIEEKLRKEYKQNAPKIERHLIDEQEDQHGEASYRDTLFSKRQALAVQKRVINVLEETLSTERRGILGITGGRTSMSAMLALGGQLYQEVDAVYHFWIIGELEAIGQIDDLEKAENRARMNEVLFPHEYQCELVWLPRYDLSKFRERVRGKTTTELANSSPSDLETINAVLNALPGRMTIEQARRYMTLLDQARAGTDPLALFDDLLAVLYKAGITDAREHLERLIAFADRGMDADTALQRWVDSVEREGPYWAKGLKESYQKYREDIGIGMEVFQTALGLLALFLAV